MATSQLPIPVNGMRSINRERSRQTPLAIKHRKAQARTSQISQPDKFSALRNPPNAASLQDTVSLASFERLAPAFCLITVTLFGLGRAVPAAVFEL